MTEVRAVISLLEDVVYPKQAYGDRACRAGAEMLKKLFGIDTLEALMAYYVPGAEELAVRAALEEQFKKIDPRLITKTAAIMAAHATRLAPYADALEVFSILQAMDLPLGLIVDGPPHAQRQLTDRLNADRIFDHIIYTGELCGNQPWTDALQLTELLLDTPLQQSALICAHPVHARLAVNKVAQVYRIIRNTPTGCRQPPNHRASNIIPMINLYDLPEALGLVAWPE
jgi:hypothetical protein